MIPKSVQRFSEKIMLKQEATTLTRLLSGWNEPLSCFTRGCPGMRGNDLQTKAIGKAGDDGRCLGRLQQPKRLVVTKKEDFVELDKQFRNIEAGQHQLVEVRCEQSVFA